MKILVIPKEFKPSNFIVHKITLSKVIKNLHKVYYLWPCKSLSQPFQYKSHSLHRIFCVCLKWIIDLLFSLYKRMANMIKIPGMLYNPIQLFILIWRFMKTILEKIRMKHFSFHLLWPLTFKYLKLFVERHLKSKEDYFKPHQNV